MMLAGDNIGARNAVTRAQFEAFQNSPDESILSTIPEEQRQKLLDVGKSVCRIHIETGTGWHSTGTGWHLGNGWVVTNTHVICDAQGLSACHDATFEFPDNKHVPASPRTVLFTKREALDIDQPERDQQKDLALVHVPEICLWNLPELNDVMQRSANDTERVYLIHYGNGIDEWPHPQQFSVCENKALYSESNEHGNVFTVHSAHSRPGSSGAPLLVYEEPMDGQDGKFLVAGVHYATRSSIQDSSGFALWFNGNNWLQKTVFYTSYAPNGIFAGKIEMVNHLQTQGNEELLDSAVVELNESCRSLQNQLTKDKFRIIVLLRLPNVNGLDPLDKFPDVVWGFESNPHNE